MSHRSLARLARMDRSEFAWRAGAAARTLVDRAAAAIARPRWNRVDLASRLSSTARAAADAVRAGRFDEAHRELSRHFTETPQRFPIARSIRPSVVERVLRDFPASVHESAVRADRVLFGAYDLLGYRGLRFDGSGRFEWNYDPVHDRRAPEVFWTNVSYLDASCGDHKVVWQLNRHQHWLTLGRAHWLTGESKYRDRCLAELASWLERNPPLIGMNWASMLELALRSLSWLWTLHFFVDPNVDDATPWTVDLLLGLDRQLTHVERNLSFYFSPNTHLLGEALALYVAGRALPELAASRRREALGRRVLLAEIGRQIAADGGHCERSAHYHRYTLDFYLLALIVARITRDPIAGELERAVSRLAFAARLLADDRGRLPHLGDDDGGVLLPLTPRPLDDVRDSLAIAAAITGEDDLRIGAAPEEVSWLLAHPVFDDARLKHRAPADERAPGFNGARGFNFERGFSRALPSAALPETGYYVSRSNDGTHLVIDGGPHGYQNGGHAHADALALTLTVRGVPLLIDPGTACYTIDLALRDRMRSTALHNTVTIDGAAQSTPAGPFHWTRTATASVARWRTNDGFDYFEGTHDGYAPISHRRHVLALHGDLLIVADAVGGSDTHTAAVHWHLHPHWTVEVRERRASLTAMTERVNFFAPRGSIDLVVADAESGLGWFSPVYGRVDPTRTIRVRYEGAAPFWMVSVFDLNRDNPIEAVDWAPIWAEAGALAQSMAVRIARATSTDYFAVVAPGIRTDADWRWRIAEFETDARMLFCRTGDERQVQTLALVDGSLVRASGRRGLQLMLPRVAPDVHLDLLGDARIAGPAFGARLLVNGRERAVTSERRATPRG
jgi:hypothetical protein